MSKITTMPALLDYKSIPPSNKMPAPGQVNLINKIRKDATTYNLILPTVMNLYAMNPEQFVDERAITLLDSIFTNSIAYMLLKPRASRGQKGQQRDAALRALIDQVEVHAEFLGIKFLVSSFKEGQVNYWLERSDRNLHGEDVFTDFLAWVETVEKTQFRDRHLKEESKLHYLTEAERQQYEVHFEGRLIKDSNDQPITTKATGGFSQLEKSAIYVCSARTRMVYSAECEVGRLHHSSFMAGEPVIAAGDWVIEDGRLRFINTASGHYRPTVGNMKMFLQMYGGQLPSDAWVQPIFKGPVYKLSDYWLNPEAAKPDEKGTRWLADKVWGGPSDYPPEPGAATTPSEKNPAYVNPVSNDPYKNRLR
jgi:hypothetical protein